MNLRKIPKSPGCYLFFDNKKKIIYVGKARDLSKRVKSYFIKKDHDEKTKALVSNVSAVDFILTDTEVEALILENNLIKKYSPKYNINLKDSKSYSYIEISKDEFPRLILTRSNLIKSSSKERLLFGPFTSGEKREKVLNSLNKIFKLRTCRHLPKRACLRQHLNLCSAPCIGKISQKEYEESIFSARMILEGKIKPLTKLLKSHMATASEKHDFEKALRLREQINAIEFLQEKQKMERQKIFDEDIINYLVREEKVYLIVFNIYKGTLENKQEFVFDANDNFFEQFLIQYYSDNKVPKTLVLPTEIDISLQKFFEHKKKSKVRIIVPSRGEYKELLELVLKNIEASFFRDTSKLESLREKLGLQDLPKVIECFDISHLSGTETVASMVQFRMGKPNKSAYRRFKINSIDGIDDFAAMAEVVKRRYARLLKEQKSLPDLILIDGGLGQLHYAMQELHKLNIKVPIISLAKREEEIFIPGEKSSLKLDRKDQARLLLEAIRDEAHRFAINYNKLRRRKVLKNS